jgi:hypothetical protein
MNKERLSEPSFIAASLACIISSLSFLIVAFRPTSIPNPEPRASELRQLKSEVGNLQALLVRLTDEMRPMQAITSAETQAKEGQQAEFTEALSKAADQLKKGEFAEAHDYLLVASRISATDRRLFDALTEFIAKAKDSRDDEVVALAEDLLDRGESLVHFQSPKDVQSSRKSLADLRSAFPEPPKKPEPEPRSGPIRRLIELASNKDLPVELRSKAAERAKSALDEAMIDSSQSSRETGDDLTPDKIKEFQKKAEEAENGCVFELFKRSRTSVQEWLGSSARLLDEGKPASPELAKGYLEKLAKAIDQGMDRLQEIVPFAKTENVDAQRLLTELQQRVGSLHRWKTWLYNREALDKIRAADTKDTAAETGLLSMATIDESLLAPYVAEKYAEVWKKLFDNLDENKKVEMTKRRVLKTIQ